MADKGYRRIVIKVGTSTLTDDRGRINLAYIARLIEQISIIKRRGTEVVLVTSGAITAGLEKLGLASERPDEMAILQAAAAIGQVELIRQYTYCANNCDMTVGQILVTRGITSDRHAYLHARTTILRLLELGALPIVNENDTIAVDEIRFGDNDTLAATVATLINADLVILLTDIEGLYTADPRKDSDAELLRHIGTLTEDIIAAAGGVGSKSGSGGMATKVEAARVLMLAGIPTVICEGHRYNALQDIISGDDVGTRFDAEADKPTINAKKLWIALGDKAHGNIYVDAGAARALKDRGSSLLPVGIIDVDGSFQASSVVNIRDDKGYLIGRGITRYSSDEILAYKGMRSSQIGSSPNGQTMVEEVIHRDEMIVF